MTMNTYSDNLINDNQTFNGAQYSSGAAISTYDDGYGPLWISRCSIGIMGIVRAKTWEDAYSICEDEFFPEANETLEEIQKEYGFKRQHVKIVRDGSVTVAVSPCAAGERIATLADYPASNGGKLLPAFIRWAVIETPDPDAWPDNELFQEAFGFRPNGPNSTDKINHGIYSKDLNGDYLDLLTPKMVADLDIKLDIKDIPED